MRDAELPARLLAVERDALVPLLRARPDADFALPTVACPKWSVRDVLAHCSSALMRVIENRFDEGVFSPECNDRDIAERAAWTNQQVVDELERAMTEAGPVLAKAGAGMDGIALGEWVHAGDVREALSEPEAYAGAGLPHALELLAWITRRHIPLHAELVDIDEPLRLGDATAQRELARFVGDAPTLLRLYSGRRIATAYQLTGAEESELNIFG